MEYGYTYKITNFTTNRFYIGQHKGKFDPTYFGSSKSLKKDISRGHRVIVEVIGYAKNQTDLDKKEIQQILKYRNKLGRHSLYNIADGGCGASGKRSPESKKNISIGSLGKKLSPEHRRKISLANIGKKLSPKTRKKIRLANLGKKHSPQTIEKMRKVKQNMSVATIEKMRLAKLGKSGYWLGRERKDMIGENNPAKRTDVREKIRLSWLKRKEKYGV